MILNRCCKKIISLFKFKLFNNLFFIEINDNIKNLDIENYLKKEIILIKKERYEEFIYFYTTTTNLDTNIEYLFYIPANVLGLKYIDKIHIEDKNKIEKVIKEKIINNIEIA